MPPQSEASFRELLARLHERSADTKTRIEAAVTMEGRWGKRAGKPLLDIFLDETEPRDLRETAGISVGLADNKRRTLVPLLHALEHHPEAWGRKVAANALCWMYSPRSYRALIRVLLNQDEDPEVRGEAAHALGNMMAWPARKAILAGLRDPSPVVRFWCIYAAAQIAYRQTITVLRQLAKRETDEIHAMWWSNRREAKWALDCVEAGQYKGAGDPEDPEDA